jgi:lysophospholipase L1-like esterase
VRERSGCPDAAFACRDWRRTTAACFIAATAMHTGCRALPQWDADRDGVVRLAVLGDSNSFAPDPDSWSWKLRATLANREPGRWQVQIYSQLGASITDNPTDSAKSGEHQIARALATSPRVDVVILAFGTNDFLYGRTAQEVVDAYAAAIQTLAHAGVQTLLAYTPPCYGGHLPLPGQWPTCDPAKIAAQNDLLDIELPDVPKVDFWSWVTPADLKEDKVHFTAEGQDKRHDAAVKTLLPWAGSPWRSRWWAWRHGAPRVRDPR